MKMCQIWWLEQIMSAERSPILGQMWEVPAQRATGMYIVYSHTYRSVSKCAHARINARGPTIGLAGRLSCHIGSKAKKESRGVAAVALQGESPPHAAWPGWAQSRCRCGSGALVPV